MDFIWYEDFTGECPVCKQKFNMGNTQLVIRDDFYKEKEIQLPCQHKIKAMMVTKTSRDKYKRRVSYSQIDMYEHCPLHWKLKYVDKIKSDELSVPLQYGLAVHETNEEFFESRRTNNPFDKASTEFIYDLCFVKHNIPFEDIDQLMLYYGEGIEMVNRFFNPKTEVEKLMVNDDYIIDYEVEMPFELLFDDVVVIGYIDLVLFTKDGIILIDHKSGSKAFDKHKLQNDLQFPIYSLAIQKQYNQMPIKCYYNFTKIHRSQEVIIDPLRIAVAERKMRELLGKMNKEKHRAIPTFLCYWCDYGRYKGGQCKYSSDFKPKGK